MSRRGGKSPDLVSDRLTYIYSRSVSGKRSAQERLPEVISAAVRVFTQDGYRAARMSDVARAAGLSEAALYRYVESKEGLFVLAIRHALLLEDLPSEGAPGAEFPLRPPSLSQMIVEAREFVAAEVPFGSLAAALGGPEPDDPAAEITSGSRSCALRLPDTLRLYK